MSPSVLAKRFGGYAGLLASLFFLDRLSKWLALNILPSDGIFAIPRLTGLLLEQNQGIAYSIPLPRTVLFAAVIAIIITLTYLAVRSYQRGDYPCTLAFCCIILGAYSNFLDRLRYGFVVDMLVVTGWPVFNLADVMIIVGASILIIRLARYKNHPLQLP